MSQRKQTHDDRTKGTDRTVWRGIKRLASIVKDVENDMRRVNGTPGAMCLRRRLRGIY
jgi:hypothetical protein